MRPTALALSALVACDGESRPSESAVKAVPAVETVATTLRIGGSDSLVASLIPALGTAFERQQPDLRVAVTGGGSEQAIEQLLDGELDLAAPCRDATPSEDEQARVAGWSLFTPESRHVVAVDVVALAVHAPPFLRHS